MSDFHDPSMSLGVEGTMHIDTWLKDSEDHDAPHSDQPTEGQPMWITGRCTFICNKNFKAIDITEENLEELLAYDDLFLDYFNAFLSLPVFPQPLYYNRLTGTFLEVQGNDIITPEYPHPVTPPYGATDEEREVMLEWAKEERLQLFLRTQLFREFKLCKLLLRTLDDNFAGSRGSSSRMLRGYSRQTESYVSSLSNSADNSANDADFDDENVHWAQVYKYRRPGSRAVSLPTRLGLARVYSHSASTVVGNRVSKADDDDDGQLVLASADSKHHNRLSTREKTETTSIAEKPSSTDVPNPDVVTTAQTPRLSNSAKSNASGAKSKAVSAKSKGRSGSSLKGSRMSSAHKADAEKGRASRLSVAFQDEAVDFDLVYGEDEPEMNGEVYVSFSQDVVSDQQTESDVKQLEGKHKMTFQQIKEQILGSVLGIEQFKYFLSDTVGSHLLNFWLDCEFFKDSMEDFDEQELMASRNALFRNIQDKYRMSLTSDARRQISQAASNAGLSHTVFIRTQYDVLRRLRAYWVPRFLIHKERMNELSNELKRELVLNPEEPEKMVGHDPSATSFFPSISLVNSLPVRADDIMHIAMTTTWESVSKGGRRLDDRVKSAKPNVRRRTHLRTMREKLNLALLADKAAGGPFMLFLERYEGGELLPLLLFWEAVQEYGMAQDRSADRLLRMCHAWNIFNKFIAKDSVYNIGVTPTEQDLIHQTLLKNRDFVEASIFNSPQQYAVLQLEKAWIRYLKEDLKSFLDCQGRGTDSPPSTADNIEVYLDDHRHHLVVRRPRPWTRRYPPSTESERGRRLRTALSMAESIDDGRRAEMRRRAKEKRKIMEKERKKAVRAAKQRMKEAKMKKNVTFKPGEGQGEEEGGSQQGSQEGADAGNTKPEDKSPTFLESSDNKAMVNMFKKYLMEMEGKEAVNHLNMYLDVEAYFSFNDARNARQKKESQANMIYKSYMEQGARKKVHLSDKTYNRLKSEKERPRSPTLRDAQQSIVPRIEELFKSFWQYQSLEMGVDNKAMANMSKAELALRADDTLLTGGSYGRKKGKTGKDLFHERLAASPPRKDPLVDMDNPHLAHISPALLKLTMSDDDYKFKIRKRRSSLTKMNSDMSGESQAASDGELKKTKSRQKKNLKTIALRETTGVLEQTSESVNYQYIQEDQDQGSQDGGPPQRRKRKPDGRAQPTREDKVEFLMALSNAAAGQLPVQMLHFYKYLVKHGEEDGVPFVDKDLFFYCEVHKFKECSHQHADEEMLRRKVQSLLDCYLECSTTPHCQLDIQNDVQQKTVRAVQRYLSGKDVNATLFDDAQFTVFRELLPYWAGFQKNFKEPSDPNKVPVTKKQKERLQRLQEIVQWKPPSAKKIGLPLLPPGSTIAALTFTLGDGVKWREGVVMDDYDTTPGFAGSMTSSDPQRSSVASETVRSTRRGSVMLKA